MNRNAENIHRYIRCRKNDDDENRFAWKNIHFLLHAANHEIFGRRFVVQIEQSVLDLIRWGFVCIASAVYRKKQTPLNLQLSHFHCISYHFSPNFRSILLSRWPACEYKTRFCIWNVEIYHVTISAYHNVVKAEGLQRRFAKTAVSLFLRYKCGAKMTMFSCKRDSDCLVTMLAIYWSE